MTDVNNTVQTVILIALIVAAAVFVTVRIIKAIRGKSGCGCGCDKCAGKKTHPCRN